MEAAGGAIVESLKRCEWEEGKKRIGFRDSVYVLRCMKLIALDSMSYLRLATTTAVDFTLQHSFGKTRNISKVKSFSRIWPLHSLDATT